MHAYSAIIMQLYTPSVPYYKSFELLWSSILLNYGKKLKPLIMLNGGSSMFTVLKSTRTRFDMSLSSELKNN